MNRSNAETRTFPTDFVGEGSLASYFGLRVEIIALMEHVCSIRYGGRDFVVETQDLQFALRLAA
jgi:hypothetical protein